MPSLETSTRVELIAGLSAELSARRASAFSKLGEAGCRTQVEAVVNALERDVETGKHHAMRGAAVAMISALMAAGSSFSDLRVFVSKLRERLLASASVETRAFVEAWSFELLAVFTTHFMVQRDANRSREVAQRDVERYESQLAELRVALEEKTALLERVREVSIPIVPVAQGVLVVPLVGTFDRLRAVLLTERLLDEIGRTKSRAVILDISGVPVFDTDAARLVIRLARSVRLLGAKVVLVGMSPENARTVVGLDVDLSQLSTRATLQDGLAQALAELNAKLRGPT